MRPLSLLAIILLLASWNGVVAGPGPKGQGKHHAHKGASHGQMPSDFRGVIHSLFSSHAKVDRAVEKTETGYTATTTSKDPEVAAMLKKHVSQMEARLESGAGVRRWDPAFVELREHYESMITKIELMENGVSVSVVGKTPEAILVAQNHAQIISDFVEKGESQMHATHPPALDTPSTTAAAAKASGKSCENCSKENCSGNCHACNCEKQGAPDHREGEKSSSTNPNP